MQWSVMWSGDHALSISMCGNAPELTRRPRMFPGTFAFLLLSLTLLSGMGYATLFRLLPAYGLLQRLIACGLLFRGSIRVRRRERQTGAA
jgi:hypothetical protein